MKTLTINPIRTSGRDRGSILVLVVVLLVLLALMGTAYLASTRIDRYSSSQNKSNTQADMVMEGVKQMALGRIAALTPDLRNGLWLSPRHPRGLGTKNTDPVAWQSVGLSLTDTALNGAVVVDPTTGATAGTFLPGAGINKDNYFFQPTTSGGKAAFTLVDASGTAIGWTGAAGAATFIAADTDGDGIADAIFFAIPGASIDGVTYYAAVRIVDNNSAINVNTAWCQTDYDHTGTAIPNQGLFLTNLGLKEITDQFETAPVAIFSAANANSQAQQLFFYHTGQTAWGANQGADLALGISGNTAATTPFDDSGASRGDFVFVSQGDALNTQLALRVDNPGKNGTAASGTAYRAFPLSDSFLLSYPFAIRPSTSVVSMNSLENILPKAVNSLTTPYAASAAGTWFQDYFVWGERTTTPADAAKPAQGARSYFVTRNPTSNTAPPPAVAGGSAVPVTSGAPASWTAHPVKADANTSDFAALWRAYWSVMANPTNGLQPRTVTDPMFLTSARGTDFVVSAANNTEMLMLRSAIAAANTIALREGDNTNIATDIIPAFDIALNSTPLPTLPTPTTYATVYGLKRQPFMTQVICERQVNESDAAVDLNNVLLAAGSTFGYIGIELYNPNPTVSVDLTNYRVLVINRAGAPAAINNQSILTIPVGPPAPTIAPLGRLIIQDGTPPSTMTIPAGVTVCSLPGLLAAAGREVILVRPRNLTTHSNGTMVPSNRTYDERISSDGGAYPDSNILYWVPLDQIDLRSLASPPALTHATVPDTNDPNTTYPVPNRQRWTYARPSYDTLAGGNNPWECVFAGNYTPGSGHDLVPTATPTATRGPADNSNPPDFNQLVYTADTTVAALGTASSVHVPALTNGGPNYAIEVNAFGVVGPSPYQAAATPKQFPFGGFARNGDLLQVPYIGSYTVTDNTTPTPVVYEMNSVSIDAVKAFDPAAAANAQQIGRFWPVVGVTTYDWTKSLFNYVTVQSPQEDLLPNAPVAVTGTAYAPTPQRVPNGPVTNPAQANQGNEWAVGVNGLINVNTASWKVLSMLPLVVNGTGQVDNATGNNDNMAKAIVTERDTNGPFISIFDLYNRVPGFSAPAGLQPDYNHGEMMANPATPTVPLAGGNTAFRTQALQLNRISNLVTTRSDTFTVYILVQGWRPGATQPEVVRQAAYHVDRNSGTPQAIQIPTH